MPRKIEIVENEAGGFSLVPSPAKEWPPQELAACLYSCLGKVLAIVLPPMPEKKKVKTYTKMPPKSKGDNGGL